MKKSSLFLALLSLLLWPVSTSAHDFNRNTDLFFSANNGVYRQKLDSRPWQLVALPSETKILQSISFDGHIWLVVEAGTEKHLFRQGNLLNFVQVADIAPAEEIVLKQTASNLVVYRQDSAEVSLVVYQPGGQMEKIAPPLLGSRNDLTRIVESDGDLLYIQQTNSNVSVFSNLRGWQLESHFNCNQSRVIEVPVIGVYCQDGTVIRRATGNQWTRLNIAYVRDIYSSEEILAGWDKADDHLFHIWRDGIETDIQLPTLAATEIDQTVVSGNRILFKKTESNWKELIWQSNTPLLVELNDTNSGMVMPISGSKNLMINGASPQVSSIAGQWQLITSAGGFTASRQTPLGVLVWNTGSLTQFAPTGSTTFTKVNPWSSTTSPIQAVEIGQVTSFISVITQSGNGNVNLYKTTDFIHWNRITLPTKPTLSPTIGQTRTLPAGSLVEISGVITVGPKVVDNEVLYLEDTTGGIQIFLSQTNGLLPTQMKVKAVVTGEISSSQTKRVLLNTLGDLDLGSQASWTQPIVSSDEAINYQGQSVQLKGMVMGTDTDYLTLGSLKLHFIGAKTVFQKDDQLIVPAVIDWNSASGSFEAWALSTDYQLVSRSQPAASATTAPTTSNSGTTTPKKSVVTKKATTPTPVVSSKPISTVAGSSKPDEVPVIVSGVQSNGGNNDSRTISMSIVSLLAGLLSFRGRRFRRYLPD
ncbi:MAG: hypothetical protein NUV80_05210 [Candidatus Berkelbacteria bacterium]|nr:hypothetical protein [Candidatus Berkelbacteria bacterium]MCR4307936.1 hypothetical protein [Candidatus Berkelbacteria bacterium]